MASIDGLIENFLTQGEESDPNAPIRRPVQPGQGPEPPSRFDEDPETKFEAEHFGVDIRSGGPPELRRRLSFQPDEKSKGLLLDKAIGKGNWRRDNEGNIIVKHDGGEVLMDERGLSWGDLNDFVGTLPEVGGGGIGALGAIALGANPVTAGGLLVLAALSALGAQFFGGAGEVVSAKSEGIPVSENITSRRATGAAIDFGLGMATGGVLNLFQKGARMASGPFAKGVNAPEQVAVKDAANRIRATPEGAGLQLSPAQETGSATLSRIEGIAEKIPGAGEPIRRTADAQDEILRGFQKGVTGEPLQAGEVGRKVAGQLDDQVTTSRAVAEGFRGETDREIAQGVGRVKRAIAPGEMIAEESADVGIVGVRNARESFRAQVKANYDAVRAEPGGTDAFVPTAGLKARARKIIKELPPERDIIVDTAEGAQAIPGGPSKAYVPPKVRAFLNSHENLADAMTIDQMIQMRRIVNDAIVDGEALPGVSTRYLRQMSTAISKSLQDAVKEAPNPAIAEKLTAAALHYRQNFEKFLEPGVVEFFREPTQRGAVTGLSLLQKLGTGRGDVQLARKLQGTLAPEEWNQVRRGVVDYILDKSENILMPGTLDPKKLASALQGMSPAMRKEILGDQAKSVMDLTRALSARHGRISLEDVSDLSENLVGGLRKAAQVEARAKTEFENSVLRPFIKNEIGESAIQPDEFVRHMMKTGNTTEIKRAMSQFTPELQEEIQNKAVQHVLQDSARSATPTDVIKELGEVPGNVLSGRALLSNLQNNYGTDAATSSARLQAIIGKDKLAQLKDLGILAATKERKEEAASAAGGLVAGSIISGIMQGNLKGAATIAKFRLFSIIMQSKAGRAWLTSGLEVPEFRKTTLAAVLGAQNAAKVYEEFKNDPDALNQMLGAVGLEPRFGLEDEEEAETNRRVDEFLGAPVGAGAVE